MALAQAFASRGARVRFVDLPRECRGWVAERGFQTAPLRDRHWDLLIADSYRFTAADWRRMRECSASLLAIDDFGHVSARCDWVLSSNAYSPRLRFAAPRKAGRLIGTKYHPLRREYWRPFPRRAVPVRVLKVLIALGGSDRGELPARLAKALREALPAAKIVVLLGPFSGTPDLPRGARAVRSPKSLRPLLSNCDLAVIAAGQTLYEAACAGVPTVALELSPDQSQNSRSMHRAGAALRVSGRTSAALASAVAAAARRLDGDPSRRRAMVRAGRSLVDGRGAPRVAQAVYGRSPARRAGA